MSEVSCAPITGEASSDRADVIFREQLDVNYRNTDSLFAKLMVLQWAACIILALLTSTYTWEGDASQIHIHVWSALLLGGAISMFPVWMIRTFPGAFSTRIVVATAQMLMSALLIGLTGGRIETHFHVFGSLVLLSFYRDWRVLVPATIVVALDHFVRGIYWPYSVYGVLTASPWRSIEHAGWVLFEDVFLVISCLRNIDEMRAVARRTAALEASERAARLIFEQAPLGMAVIGLDDRFTQANTTLCEMLEYPEEELVRRTPFDLTFTDDLDSTRESALGMLNGEARSVIEKRYVRKNGQVVWTSRTACAIRDESGRPHHFLLMIEDISDRKRAEEELRASKRELESALRTNQLIMDNSKDVICTIDAAGRFVTVSAACEELWGYAQAELIGRPYIDFVHSDDREKTNRAANEIFARGSVGDFVNRYVRKDGATVDVLWSASWSEKEMMMFCVAHDVTERSRIEKEMRQAKDDADRANHAKSEFLSRMSHELRTPLNAILGFGQLLERQSPTDTQRTRIHYIISAGRHLLNLINEVLDISRIEAGNLQLSVEPVRLEDAVSEAVDLVKPLAVEQEIELSVSTEETPECFVRGDRQRLKQVLLNLLSNAIKYTPPGGRVTVSYGSAGDHVVRLSVRDTGRGIAADKLSRLFTSFDRLGAEQSGVAGTGLGLALCQRLMQAMQGSISASSSVGSGSTFCIEIPLAESPLARLPAEHRPAPQALNGSSGERRIILYIEDNLSNLTLMEQMLADQPDLELITAMQGRLGFDLALKHSPDLILLDLHLPDVPGWDVLDQLKRNLATCHIPVVVLSADATKRQIDRLMAGGALTYLTKPLDVAEFYRAIEEPLAGAKPETAVCAAA